MKVWYFFTFLLLKFILFILIFISENSDPCAENQWSSDCLRSRKKARIETEKEKKADENNENTENSFIFEKSV